MVKVRLNKYSKYNEELYCTFGPEGGGIAGNIIIKEDESKQPQYFFRPRDGNRDLVPIAVNGKNAVRFNKDGFLRLPSELSSYFD